MASVPYVSMACFRLQSPFKHDLILLVSGVTRLSRTLFYHHTGGRTRGAQRWGGDEEAQGCCSFLEQEAQEGDQEEALEDEACGAWQEGRGPWGWPSWDSASCFLAPSRAQRSG